LRFSHCPSEPGVSLFTIFLYLWPDLSINTSTQSDFKIWVGNVCPSTFFRISLADNSTVYIVYCVWIAFELVVVFFFFKETQGMSLEETSAIFDGPEAVRTLARAADNAADNTELRGSTPEGKEKDLSADTVHAL